MHARLVGEIDPAVWCSSLLSKQSNKRDEGKLLARGGVTCMESFGVCFPLDLLGKTSSLMESKLLTTFVKAKLAYKGYKDHVVIFVPSTKCNCKSLVILAKQCHIFLCVKNLFTHHQQLKKSHPNRFLTKAELSTRHYSTYLSSEVIRSRVEMENGDIWKRPAYAWWKWGAEWKNLRWGDNQLLGAETREGRKYKTH